MAMKVGCFALVNAFSTLPQQLAQIKEWGFKYADVTDTSDGACLGAEYGFTSMASLDANPFDLKRMFETYGITMTGVCAHANLFRPGSSIPLWNFTVDEGSEAGGIDGGKTCGNGRR